MSFGTKCLLHIVKQDRNCIVKCWYFREKFDGICHGKSKAHYQQLAGCSVKNLADRFYILLHSSSSNQYTCTHYFSRTLFAGRNTMKQTDISSLCAACGSIHSLDKNPCGWFNSPLPYPHLLYWGPQRVF